MGKLKFWQKIIWNFDCMDGKLGGEMGKKSVADKLPTKYPRPFAFYTSKNHNLKIRKVYEWSARVEKCKTI